MSKSLPDPTPGSGRPRPVPRLLAISAGRVAVEGDDPRFDAWLDRLATAGVDAVQIREKHLDDRRLLEVARRARETLPAATLVLVNGRVDIALSAGADGVHLPSTGLPVAALRRRWGAEIRIGRSTHSVDEVVAAREAGADYVTFGPVYPTPSKAGYGPPPGLAGLRQAAATGLPVLALGGVLDAQRLAEVAATGARGAAGIRAFEADSLAELVGRAREVFAEEPRSETHRGAHRGIDC